MMTRAKALLAATDWWYRMMRDKVWDNGDRESECVHKCFASPLPALTDSEWATIREAIAAAVEKTGGDLYADYGCWEIDDELKARGIKRRTCLLGPHKAGTKIAERDGGWVLIACPGYAHEWAEVQQ